MLKDNSDRACELVYEYYTGLCWHEADGDNGWICIKCEETGMPSKVISETNPDLANSLDAWAEHIWPVMRTKPELHRSYAMILADEVYWQGYPDSADRASSGYIWELDAIHHLEAALKAARVKCDRCGGTGQYNTFKDGPKNGYYGDAMHITPCTCDNGEITLWEKLRREVG